LLIAPFTLIVQGILSLLQVSTFAWKLKRRLRCERIACSSGGLLGFIGPVPPPARDKSIRSK